MAPNSAPKLEPDRPAQIREVMSGAKARTVAMATVAGIQASAPNSIIMG